MKHMLAGVLNDRHRHAIHAVVDEYFVRPKENSLLFELMPVQNVPASVLEHEIVSGYGGKTGERVLGAPGKSISGPSATGRIFKPGAYQEFIRFSEGDLLKLRKLGSLGDRGVTGLTGGELNFMEMSAQKLGLRLINRMLHMGWDALLNGRFVYQGVTFDFGVPATNVIGAATDWSTVNVGTPFEDLLTLINTHPVLIKYRAIIKGFAINPKTAADIVKRALEKGYITNANVRNADINEVAKFAAPGLPPFVVVDDAMQEETIDAAGQVTLGNAEYLFPDDVVMPILDFAKAGARYAKYGELQITENMNDPSATVERPAVGPYTFVNEEPLKDRKSPAVEVVSGFNGGANLMRPFDVIKITV